MLPWMFPDGLKSRAGEQANILFSLTNLVKRSKMHQRFSQGAELGKWSQPLIGIWT